MRQIETEVSTAVAAGFTGFELIQYFYDYNLWQMVQC